MSEESKETPADAGLSPEAEAAIEFEMAIEDPATGDWGEFSVEDPAAQSEAEGEERRRTGKRGRPLEIIDRRRAAQNSGPMQVPPAGDGIERRNPEGRREIERVRAAVLVASEWKGHTAHRVSGDLSASGIFLEGFLPFPPGSTVNVRFEPPDAQTPGDEIAATAEVVRFYTDDERRGVGLRFIELADDDRQRLLGLVQDTAVDDWFRQG